MDICIANALGKKMTRDKLMQKVFYQHTLNNTFNMLDSTNYEKKRGLPCEKFRLDPVNYCMKKGRLKFYFKYRDS